MLFLLKRRRSPRRYGMKNMNIIGIRMISAVAAVMLWFAGSASAKGSASLREARMNDGYTFKLNENVRRTRVTFKNRFGIVLAGDLYEPKAGGGKFSAIAVCGAFGGVKEQASGFLCESNGFARIYNARVRSVVYRRQRRRCPVCRIVRYQHRRFQRGN